MVFGVTAKGYTKLPEGLGHVASTICQHDIVRQHRPLSEVTFVYSGAFSVAHLST